MKRLPVLTLIIIMLITAACNPESTPLAPDPTAVPPASLTEASPTQAFPQTPAPSPTAEAPQAVIVEAINTVDAHPYADQDWESAMVDMELFPGGEVWAKENATSLVSMLESASLMRVAPNTTFTLETPDANTLSINLQEGQIWLNIEGLEPGETFQVETPTAVASVRGTRFSVRVAADGTTVISVREGHVDVSTLLGSTTVNYYGQITIFPGGSIQEGQKISMTELLQWGMASGSQLRITLPLGDLLASAVISSTISGGDWSYDGQIFQYATQESIDNTSYYYTMHYNLTSGETYEITAVPTTTSMVALSPVENRMAWAEYSDEERSICTGGFDGEGKNCFEASDDRYYLGGLSWSPDGQWLLYLLKDTMYSINDVRVTEDVLYRCRADGSECLQLTDVGFGYLSRPTWSPDGTQIAYTFRTSNDHGDLGQLWLMNADGTGAVLAADGVTGFDERKDPLSWSPDGQWIALGMQDGLFLFNPSDASLVPLVTEPGVYLVRGWSPTPTGWPLIYSSVGSDGFTRFYLLDRANSAPFAYDYLQKPIFSPDGTLAALISMQNVEDQFTSHLYIFEVLPLWP